jgi:hypothetical protein
MTADQSVYTYRTEVETGLTVDIVHTTRTGIPAPHLICPSGDGRQVTFRFGGQDRTELLLDRGVEVDLGDGSYYLVS